MATSVRPTIASNDVKLVGVLAATIVAACALLGLIVALTASDCSAPLAIPGICRSSVGVPLGIGIAALPLVAYFVARRPLVAFFSLYAVLVPIDDALLVGQSLTVGKILGVAAVLAAVALLVQRRAKLQVPYAVFGWAALVGLMALSTSWTIDPALSAQDLGTVVSTFGLMAILAAVPLEAAEFDTIVGATIASGVIAGIVAIVMARSELSNVAGQVGRLYLTFGTATLDPNRFGASLLLPVALTVATIVKTNAWRRIAMVAVLFFPIAAIYLSASRGTTLALAAMAIVAILASRYRFALGSMLFGAVMLFFAIPNEIASRFLEERSGVNAAGRFDIWRVAVETFREHWLLGNGVGAFSTAYDRAFLMAYEPQFAGWTRAPHSLIISTSTELGVVGIVVTIAALVLQYRSLRSIKPGQPYSWLGTPLRAAFVGLLVAALFVDVLETKFSWLLFTEMLLAARLCAQLPARAPNAPSVETSAANR